MGEECYDPQFMEMANTMKKAAQAAESLILSLP